MYSVQSAVDSTQPAPFVTQPYLYDVHAAFVVSVVAAELHGFTEQNDVVLIMHPVSQVSLHEDSDIY